MRSWSSEQKTVTSGRSRRSASATRRRSNASPVTCSLDPEDARDAAQEALAKLCVRIGQFRGESQFSTWLHRLVVNTCRDVAARQRVRRCEPLHEDERVAEDADPAREAGLAELRLELNAGLAGISPDQAKVVVLKDALDFSFAEIAEAV